MKSNNYRPDLSSLHEVLANKRRYEIPDYQRRYRWDVSKVDELWEDIVDLYKDDDHRKVEYLLGSIVTVRGTDKTPEKVIDGQQRLVSLTLMFCAIRNSLKGYLANANDVLTGEINNLTNAINEYVYESHDVFIKLNHVADRSLFEYICHTGNRDGDDYEKRRARTGKSIHKNYAALCVHADALCNDLGISNSNLDGIMKLKEIINAITNRVCVIDVTVEDENDAQQIFEALNSKGQQLTQSDLIKSYLIQKSSDAKKNWDDALAPFESELKRNPRKADEYIYYSLLSRKTTSKDVAKRELYKQVKAQVSDEDSADEFIAELKEDIMIIKDLEKPHQESSLGHLLHGLKQLNAIYFRRPILAAVRRWGWDDQRTEELVEFLLKFFFMYRSIRKMDVGNIRNIARYMTASILDKENDFQIKAACRKSLESVGKMTTVGSSAQLNLDEFHERFLENFVSADYDRRQVILYAFISIERMLQANQFTIPEKGVDVEHVFPQRSHIDAWPNLAELKRYKNNIGNLTLLPHRWNNTLQNFSFVAKKTGMNNGKEIVLTGKDSTDKNGKPIVCSYQNSNFKINDDIQTRAKWGVDEVIERQACLRKYAEKIWNLRDYT